MNEQMLQSEMLSRVCSDKVILSNRHSFGPYEVSELVIAQIFTLNNFMESKP